MKLALMPATQSDVNEVKRSILHADVSAISLNTLEFFCKNAATPEEVCAMVFTRGSSCADLADQQR